MNRTHVFNNEKHRNNLKCALIINKTLKKNMEETL